MMPRIAPLAVAGLLFLGGANLYFFTAVFDQTASDGPPASSDVKWVPSNGKPADPVVIAKPIEAYKVILAHPVFFKTREPFIPPAPSPPAPPPKATQAPAAVDPGLILGGVMTNPRLRKAYLLTKANSAGSWVNEGEIFLGWKLQSVDVGSAKLQQQDRTIELQLYPQNQTVIAPLSP
jgi:hypothetical protein